MQIKSTNSRWEKSLHQWQFSPDQMYLSLYYGRIPFVQAIKKKPPAEISVKQGWMVSEKNISNKVLVTGYKNQQLL